MVRTKTALVTGGSGFIGKSLVRKLLNIGYHVVVVDDFSTSERMLPSNNLEVIEEDIRLFKGINQNIDIVFHLASLVGMELCYSSSQSAYDVITDGTKRIVDLYPNLPKVFFSSSCVYGLNYSEAVNEEMDISYDEVLEYDGNKLGYATGKWQMEKIINDARKNDKSIIIRPFNVVGAEQSSSYGMVIPKFIKAAIQGEPLTVFDTGNQQRCFSYIDDFLEVLLDLTSNPNSWTPENIVYNIGNPVPTNISDLAELVINELGSTSEIKYINYQNNIVRPYIFNS